MINDDGASVWYTLAPEMYVLPFFTDIHDHWQYGTAQISQLDTTIDGTSYRFIAEDMKGKIIMVEIVNSNPEQARLFVAPQTVEGDKATVILAIADVNGDGKPDIVVTVHGQEFVLFGSTSGFSWTGGK